MLRRSTSHPTLALCTLAPSMFLAQAVNGATFIVDSRGNDEIIDTDGRTCLREAIGLANASAGPDVIQFQPIVFGSPETITLALGEMLISDSLTIVGPAAPLTISGNGAGRIFNINGAGTLTVILDKLSLTAGAVTGIDEGGAIYIQDENVTLTNCAFSGNSSADSAGAVQVEATGATLSVSSCTFLNNIASQAGGAIACDGTVTLQILNSTFSGNQSQSGGALNQPLGGGVLIEGCTLSGNSSGDRGGAMFLNGNFTSAVVRNSTLSGNTAANSGGALELSSSFPGTLTVQNSTITANTATNGSGGGINRAAASTGTISMASAIVSGNAANTAAVDLSTGGTVNAAACLIGTSAGVATLAADSFTTIYLGVSPALLALANNGGPTQTHALSSTSPAINRGSNPALLTFDQRGPGYPRTASGATDIGAFESAFANPPAVALNVDIDTSLPATPGYSAPTSAFGGAANQPGIWNNLAGVGTGPILLVDISGAPMPATLTRDNGAGGDFGFNNANTSRDFEKLLDDCQDIGGVGSSRTFTFTGLGSGLYKVITYAVAPDDANFRTNVAVTGSTNAVQPVGGTIPANGFALGATHARHYVTVQPNTPLVITATTSVGFGTINGIQIRPSVPCASDFAPPGGDDAVNVTDLLAVIAGWGACPAPCPPHCAADIAPPGGDCVVNVTDLLAVIAAWGPCQ